MTHDLAREAGISRQAAYAHLSGLVKNGFLKRSGQGRGTRYSGIKSDGLLLTFSTDGLEEDNVWSNVSGRSPAIQSANENAKHVLQYAFAEIVNNAIEHSGSKTIDVFIPESADPIIFEVTDYGVGIFDHVQRRLGLDSRLSAIQELSKGKVTTAPERHTGEGLFFVSKAADVMEIDSGGLVWIVDNLRQDHAVLSTQVRQGTRVRVAVSSQKKEMLQEIFSSYTHNFEFSKSKIVVKLFSIGVLFMSRSEARRLVQNLEKFKEVVLDFKGVQGVGQGFADEIFRVWKRAHPDILLAPVNMSEEVEFMINRAKFVK